MEGIPDDVFEPISVDVVLGGQTFVFREPVRRQARALMGRVLRMMARNHEAIRQVQRMAHTDAPEKAEVTEDSEPITDDISESLDLNSAERWSLAANGMDFTNETLDFIYDALGLDAATRKTLDDDATEDEIGIAFSSILETINRPFVGSPAIIQETKTPNEVSPPNS